LGPLVAAAALAPVDALDLAVGLETRDDAVDRRERGSREPLLHAFVELLQGQGSGVGLEEVDDESADARFPHFLQVTCNKTPRVAILLATWLSFWASPPSVRRCWAARSR